MSMTTPKRLLGLVLTTGALFFLFFLYRENAIVRGKGFKAPLFDEEDWPKAVAYGVAAVVGLWLTWADRKKVVPFYDSRPTPDKRKGPAAPDQLP